MNAKIDGLKDKWTEGWMRETKGWMDRERECTYVKANNGRSIFDKSSVSHSDCSCGYKYLFNKYFENI